VSLLPNGMIFIRKFLLGREIAEEVNNARLLIFGKR